MKKPALHIQIVLGMILGILFALLSVQMGIQTFVMDWIAPFGKVFISLLKLIALPLVLFSIIKGIADLQDIKALGSLGIKTLALYLVTTSLAISLGLSLVNAFAPGKSLPEEMRITNRLSYELWTDQTEGVDIKDGKRLLEDPAYAKYLTNAEERNAQYAENESIKTKQANAAERKNQGPLAILDDIIPTNIYSALGDNSAMLQVIFFALFFGIMLLLIQPNDARPIHQLINGFNEVFLKMVDVVMKGAPIFVFALMAGQLVDLAGENLRDIGDFLFTLLYYCGVVIGGLFTLIFIIYPLAAIIIVKKFSYLGYLRALNKAQLLAFSTSSSAATLPVTMDCVTNNLKVPKKITSFVLPIGATVNMDGTSLYISVAVVFLAQLHMVDLSLAQQLTIVLTATMASIGASAVPSAGLIMMIMVLESVGLNPAWIALIFPVDRILDMCRTAVNVTGDATVAAVVNTWTTKEQQSMN